METTKRITLVLILALFTTSPVISAESELSNTTSASCLLKITSNPTVLPLEEDIIEYLLHSSGVAGKAAYEVLDTKFDDNFLDVERLAYQEEMTTPASEKDLPPDVRMPAGIHNDYYQMILMRIVVNIEPVGIAAAEELMDAIIKNLSDSLNHTFDDYRNNLNNRLQIALEESDRTENEVRIMQEKLNNISGSTILDKDRILNEIDDLHRDLNRIQMEQTSDEIIVHSIAQQIAEARDKSKEQLADDAVIKELEQLLENQNQLIATIRKQLESGRTSVEQLTDIEEKITRTKIELAQRREQLNRTAGGDNIQSLNRQLAEHSLQKTLNERKAQDIERQIAMAEELLSKADNYELLSLKFDIAKQNLKEAILWRDRMSRQIRMLQPPSVSVIGAN